MIKSKRISLVTIFAMLVSSLSLGVTAGAANAATTISTYKTFTINGTDINGDTTIDLAPGTSSVSLNVEGTPYIDPLIKLNGVEVARTQVITPVQWYYKAVTTETGVVCSDGNTSGVPYEFTADVAQACSIDGVLQGWVENRRDYVFNGALNGLVSGDNILTVEAKDDHNYGAPGGVTTVTLHVIPLLSSITVNGEVAAEGSTIDLLPNTSSVDVTATAIDPLATVVISGATGLVAGENTLSVAVTNPAIIVTPAVEDDPTTPDVNEAVAAVTTPGLSFTYTITLNVAVSTNTEATINVNGVDRAEGEDIYVDYGTTSVDVAVTPLDPGSTYFIDGDLGLVTGDNDLVVTVIAADGTTTYDYHFNVVVHANTDTSVNFITVNGEAVVDGSSLDIAPLTTEVDVQVDTTDIEATFTIDGDHDLVTGDNQLMITVVAADGETEQQYFINLNVLPNTDVSLASLTVNGNEVADNDYVDLDPLTTDVTVEVVTTDPEASFEIVGGTDLVVGENDLFINVTAADGETTGTTYIVLNVLPNTDTSLASLTVNGEETADGGVVYLEPFTTEVAVDVTTTDPEATFIVSGDTDLMVGENDLVISVTAADGLTTEDFVVTLVVAKSNDASIVGINVTFVGENGEETVQVTDGDEINLLSKTTMVGVNVETTDAEATVAISGDTDLVVGENTLTVTVTAADGETVEDYYVTLIVAVGDVTLSTFTVNEAGVADGDVVDLEPGTDNVDIVVETTDEDATYEVTGGSNLVLGANDLIVEVTSVDGTLTVQYKVTLNVLPYDDATFSSIEVNGVVWEDGTVLVTDAGDLDVVVATNNEYATVQVIGSTTNVSGMAQLQVVVTAQDGETQEEAMIMVLAESSEMVVTAASTSGELRIGNYAQIPRSQFPKSAKVTFGWFIDNDLATMTEGAKHKLTLDDFGHNLRAVAVVIAKGALPVTVISKPVDVLPGLITKAPTPAIKGKAMVGNTLTATTKDWADGIETSIQWYRNGEAIDGANSDTLDLTADDFDATITVGITGTMEGYEPLEKLSTGVKIAAGVLKYSDRPGISGDFVTGGTVEVNPGSWPDGAEVSIVWMRNGEEFQTTAADENTYVLTAEDYKTRLSVNIVVTLAGYKDAIYKMKSRTIKIGTLAEVPTPVINGDPMLGETLDADAGEYPEGAEFKYVWKRNGRVIHTAYDSSYTVNVRDVGTTLTVKVIATIPGYKTVRVESEGVEVTAAQ